MAQQARTLTAPLESEKMAWLDDLANPLQQALHWVFRSGKGGRTAKNWLNGVPLRHRVHPALVIVPLGAWTTAALFDILEILSSKKDKQSYRKGANAAIACGVVGALPAAAAGLADWVDTYDHPRRVGTAHAVLNTIGLACYSGSLALRLLQKRRAGKVLSTLGFCSVALGGALGGEMVYGLGVNVRHVLYPKPPNEFVDVLASTDLPEGQPTVVEVGRVPVLLLRHQGQVLATEAWCTHAGGPLHEGVFDGAVVECPWHQTRFCLTDGRPLNGPASAPLRTFEIREQAGRIAVRPRYEGQSWPPPPPPPRAEPLRVTAPQ